MEHRRVYKIRRRSKNSAGCHKMKRQEQPGKERRRRKHHVRAIWLEMVRAVAVPAVLEEDETSG